MPRFTSRAHEAPTASRVTSRMRPALLWALAVLAGAVVLFPFDWLGNVWPAYGAIFDQVFASAQSHMFGHAVLFFIAGSLVLAAMPRLRHRPLLFLGVMVLLSLAEEGIQSLFKAQLPRLGDGRDLLLDLVGYASAYAVAGVRQRIRPAWSAQRRLLARRR